MQLGGVYTSQEFHYNTWKDTICTEYLTLSNSTTLSTNSNIKSTHEYAERSSTTFRMNVLLRHTILGEAIRLAVPKQFPYAEELDPTILKTLITIRTAQSDPNHADENSALLADGEQHFGSGTLLVEWYDMNDSEVRPVSQS